MDVDDAAAGEDLVELVALQLVVAGAAAHHHGLDVQVVQGGGHAVEEHPVVGDHLLGLVELARAALGITAAQVARRQHRLHTGMPKHGLRGQAHLAEQALRAAAGEVEHRLGLGGGGLRVPDDGHIVLVLDVEQRPRRLLGQAARQLLVDEVDHLLLERCGAYAGGRVRGLALAKALEHVNGQPLGLEAHAHHGFAQQLDGVGVGGVQHRHGHLVARTEALLAHLAQQVAHVHGHIAKVDLDRAWRGAFVADRAVLGHVFKLLPVADGHAPAGLLFIQKGLDQQRGRQNLVARAVEQVGARHMGGADRLALAATQAVLDRIGNRADMALLHDQRLMAHQPERRRVGIGQVGIHQRLARFVALVGLLQQQAAFFGAQQLALVEVAMRIDAGLVLGKGPQLVVTQELQLGDANAVLARDHAIEAARQRHDAGHGRMGGGQHLVVIAVHRQVGVHIAVARMHVQSHKHPALEHALVDGHHLVHDRLVGGAAKNRSQGRAQIALPTGAQAVVLQVAELRVHAVQPALPALAHLGQQHQRLRHPVFQQLGRRDVVGIVLLAQWQLALGKKGVQRIAELDLVVQRQLDIDALDAIGVLGHARQRDDHVFIDLEGIGVAADGGGALAVQPEFLARLGADGNKAFAAARVGNTHHFAGHARHFIGVVANDVAKQHHLGQAAMLFALGGIAHRLQVAVIQVLQPGQQHAAALLLGKHVVLDLDDRGHGILGIAKKLQADGTHMRGHAVHHPAGAGNEAIAALFLDARQAREELVRHILAQAFLAELVAWDVQSFGAHQGLAVGLQVLQLKAGHLGVVDLAQVVVQSGDFQPLRIGRHHAPAGQVVQRRAPEHRLFTARIHGDIAANAGGLDRGGIDREHKTAALGRIGHALGHHTSLRPDGGHQMVDAGQRDHLHLGHLLQLLSVDDSTAPAQRNGATGVAGAAAARHDGQAQADTGLDQHGHFLLGIWGQHHKRVFHPPVGRVGHMAHAREAVKLDVVLGGQWLEGAQHLAAQLGGFLQSGVELRNRHLRSRNQLPHQRIARRVFSRCAALLHFAQAVLQCLHQLLAPAGVVQEVVLQIRIALHHPDIAQNLIQHAGRAARLALLAQLVQQIPGLRAQQADDDFAVGERGVVVGNLAETGGPVNPGLQAGQRNRCVHVWDLCGSGRSLLWVRVLCKTACPGVEAVSGDPHPSRGQGLCRASFAVGPPIL